MAPRSPMRMRVASSLWVSLLVITSCLVVCSLPAVKARDVEFIEKKLKEYMSCFDFNCFERKTTWSQWNEYINPCLSPAGVWHSTKGIKSSALIPVTVITQLSLDRLFQVESQCDSWQGPLVAAVHMGVVQSVGNDLNPNTEEEIGRAILDVQALFDKAEKGKIACQLTIVLFYEIYAERRATLLYPVNSLRNYARLLADTDLIANIDVDMLISDKLSELLQQPEDARDLVNRIHKTKSVVVLPAFEQNATCNDTQLTALAMTKAPKASLKAHIDKGCADMYAFRAFFGGHNTTDYTRWFAAKKPYTVQYTELYEPWFISDRFDTHWYDVRYRGYGKNKIMQVTHMNVSGFRFDVHPEAFILHKFHNKSTSKLEYIDVKSSLRKKAVEDARLAVRGTMFEKVERMYLKHMWQMKNNKYYPKSDTTLVKCLDRLSWWRNHYEDSSRWLPAWAWTRLFNGQKAPPKVITPATSQATKIITKPGILLEQMAMKG